MGWGRALSGAVCDMMTYLLVYSGALLAALASTPAVIRLAFSLKAVDLPGLRKIHQKAVPRIGGAAIVFSTLVGMAAAMLLNAGGWGQLREAAGRLVVLFLAGLVVFGVGFADDLRGLRARQKLAGQIVAAAALCLAGVRIEQVAPVSWLRLELGWLSWPATLLWVVGITNAVNLMDGLDGLAAGICAVACGVILILALHAGQAVMAVLMLSLLGSLTGFLVFNFAPARVFLGDCGSMFLGFMLAGASVMCAAKVQTFVGLALPALALGLPIFDTLFSILRRFLERRGIMSPDRSHLHHKLLDMGLRQRHVVVLLYVLTLAATGLGMFMMVTRDAGRLIVFACVVMLVVAVFRLVGVVGLRRTVRALRRNLRIAREVRLERQRFEEALIRVGQAESFEQWWAAVCDSAGELDVGRLQLRAGEGGPARAWENPARQAACQPMLRMTAQVARGWGGRAFDLEMETPVNGSLEAACRRVALLGRLLEEGFAELPRQHRPPVRRRRSSPLWSAFVRGLGNFFAGL